MIIALCTVTTVLTLLATPSVAQGSAFTAPCPDVFTYDPAGSAPGSWAGVAILSTDILLLWMQLNLVLDSPALGVSAELGGWKGNSTTNNNVHFEIDNDDVQIYPGYPETVRIIVKYDPLNATPRLLRIKLNEKVICNAEAMQPPKSPDHRVPNTEITTDECGLVAGGNERYPLIYDGNFYGREQIPWLVAIYRVVAGTLLFICGGSLVSDHHVVTAAHCMRRPSVVTPLEEIVVKVGAHSLNDLSDDVAVTRKLTASSIHEEYDPDTLQTDILVLTLDKRVKFNRYIRPVCLWSGDTALSRVVGAIGVVAGWGDRSMNDTRGRTDEPQMVRIPIVSTKECRASKAVFHKLTYSTTLCAGDRNGAGPCKGDSGSGLYLLDDGKWRLRGVVSLSLQNAALTCDLNEYIVFTDTAQVLPWIMNILSEKYFEAESTSVISESFDCGVVFDGNEGVTLSVGTAYVRGNTPWLVAIFLKDEQSYSLRYICGGTLVSNRHVITAAHCMGRSTMESAVRNFVIKIGAHNVNDWTEDITVTRKIVSVAIHENYKPAPVQNDIMIFTLNKRVTFNRYIRPACLWTSNTELSRVVGASGIVAGWGLQHGSPGVRMGFYDEPLKVRENIVSTQDCRASNAVFEKSSSNTTLCAESQNPCWGSSGVGLVLLEGGRWTLRGVSLKTLDEVEEGCDLNAYTVYTDVAQFLPWIRNILAEKYID